MSKCGRSAQPASFGATPTEKKAFAARVADANHRAAERVALEKQQLRRKVAEDMQEARRNKG